MLKMPRNSNDNKGFPGVLNSSRRVIKSMQAKADAKRKFSEKLADFLTKIFGSIPFLTLNAIWFTIWILINIGMIPGMQAFDPYPFGLLTTIVSLEAIMLAIFVLISQNRQNKVDDLREEVDLQVDIITEKEVTKMLQMLTIYLEKQKVISVKKDKELATMLKITSLEKIENSLEKEFNIIEN